MQKFYDVETYDERKQDTIKIENFGTIEEAKEYIVRTIKNKLIDYNQKLILFKRLYDNDEEFIEERKLIEYNIYYDDDLTEYILQEVKQ